jgi:hypothetical protein
MSEQQLEDLKNKDIQIELRKEYYDNYLLKKGCYYKGAYSTTLCYCNRFHSKISTERHECCKTHKEYCIKINNEESLIKEENPEYLLQVSEFLYKNQYIKYYYFTTIDILNAH